MSSLLARIGAPERTPSGASPDALLRASILDHLRKMCRTRRGTMRARPDFGLPDLSEMVHSFPEAIGIVREALQRSIQRYEPRLANVRVAHVPSATLDLVLRFEITATLASTRATPVRFETQLNASRAVTVT